MWCKILLLSKWHLTDLATPKAYRQLVYITTSSRKTVDFKKCLAKNFSCCQAMYRSGIRPTRVKGWLTLWSKVD